MRLFSINDLNFNEEDFLDNIDGNDEFITKEELENNPTRAQGEIMDLFVIRLYKCVDCGKWIIDILE